MNTKISSRSIDCYKILKFLNYELLYIHFDLFVFSTHTTLLLQRVETIERKKKKEMSDPMIRLT